MIWIIPAIIATILWSITNIFDKFVIDKEMRDPILASVVFGMTYLIVYGSISLVKREFFAEPRIMIIAFLAGVVYFLSAWVYYYVISKKEISTVVPVFFSSNIFVLLLAFIFLGERLTAIRYLGVFTVILGSLILSVKNIKHHLRIDLIMVLAFLGAFFTAIRNILLKYATEVSLWTVYFWVGLGIGSVAIIFLIIHHPHIRRKAKFGIGHLSLATVISCFALLFYVYALSLGKVSLVTGFMGIQPLIVFLMAFFLSKFYPKIIHERLSKKELVKKLVSIGIIIVGVILLL